MRDGNDDLMLALPIVVLSFVMFPALVLAPIGYALFRYLVAPRYGSIWFGWFAVAAVFITLVLAYAIGVKSYFASYGSTLLAFVKQNQALDSMHLLALVGWSVLPALALGAVAARWRLKTQRNEGEGNELLKSRKVDKGLQRVQKTTHPANGVLLGGCVNNPKNN